MKGHYENYVAPWLGKTMKMIDHRLEELLEEHHIDITNMQFAVLKTVARQEGISQNKLAMFADRDKSSLTRMIATLERKDYVRREASREDKRVNAVYITDRGKEIIRIAAPLLNRFALQVEEGLSEEEINTTIKIMKKIQDNMTSF
jgi:DNA-binding MarR family transcriptional regulator